MNIQADLESRSIHDNMEWKLHPILFNKICVKWGIPEIDLFANRLNNQLDRYISWKPDPGAMAVDAFALDWHKINFYAFPPFNMIGRVLRKVEDDQAEGLVVVPFWPTQHWFSKFANMCTDIPSILFSRDAQTTLEHPWRREQHLPSMRLLVAPVSGIRARTSPWEERQGNSLSHHGDTQRQYARPLKLWTEFCRERHQDYLSPNLTTVLDFVASLYTSGLGYSAITQHGVLCLH